MRRVKLPHTDLEVSALAYGCMRVAGTWNPAEITAERDTAGQASILAAYEAGYTLFDHADIYCSGGCEEIHGRVLKGTPSMRREIVLATKCGIRFPGNPNPNSPHRFDFRAKHIVASCERSLTRLRTDVIDIYQLHRPDYLMNPAEVAEAFTSLRDAGKVRYFGVSNFLPSKLSALQKHLAFPLVVNQIEVHLGRLAPFEDGTLDQCVGDGIAALSWSPLGGGWLGEGQNVPDGDPRAKLLDALDEQAVLHGVTRTEIALAWLMVHPAPIVPIVGTTRPDRIRQATNAAELELGRETWYRLMVAARGEGLP